MLHLILQIWGGSFYLLNKMCLSRAERSSGKTQAAWKTRSWIAYLIGLPPWVAIFIIERNWIVAAVEASSAAAMVLGLVISIRGKQKTPVWLDLIAVVGAATGIAISLIDAGGLRTATQLLELVVVVGFLCGAYLLAKLKPLGYLFLAPMNLAAGTLMYIQGYHWLALQQLASLTFVADAYLMQKRRAGEGGFDPVCEPG